MVLLAVLKSCFCKILVKLCSVSSINVSVYMFLCSTASRSDLCMIGELLAYYVRIDFILIKSIESYLRRWTSCKRRVYTVFLFDRYSRNLVWALFH
jgi:hypothetical protein